MAEKLLRVCVLSVSVMAIVELAFSQFAIGVTRLSAVETTGISLFAFIIFSLITMFAVSRMKESFGGKLFAVLMNFITALAAVWYLRLLFSDEIFFRNLFYTLNRQTQDYEMLPLGSRITASMPVVLIFLGAAVYTLSGITILLVSITTGIKKIAGNKRGE